MIEKNKRVRLTKRQMFDNFLFKFTPCFTWVLVVGWTLILWFKAQRRWQPKHPNERFRFESPKVLTVVTIDHQHTLIKQMLSKQYHVNYLFLNYEWVILQNTVCLRGQYLVAKNMYDKVDSILFNSGAQSELWHCEHTPGTLRHVQFRPHTATQEPTQRRRQAPLAKAKQATLGKTYR